MPAVHPLPASVLQPLLPLREVLGSHWETILTGVVSAPDPALAATNLSRLAEHGLGSGVVMNTPDLCRDLLFLLGSSQHLTTVLLNQEQGWEEAFLADRQSGVKSAEAQRSTLRLQLPLDLSEGDFLRGLRAYRNREYLRIGTRDLLALAPLEETI